MADYGDPKWLKVRMSWWCGPLLFCLAIPASRAPDSIRKGIRDFAFGLIRKYGTHYAD